MLWHRVNQQFYFKRNGSSTRTYLIKAKQKLHVANINHYSAMSSI